jgi:hypothetical protein
MTDRTTAQQTTTDALLERTVCEFLVLRSLLDPARTRRISKTKAEKLAREIVAELNAAIAAGTIKPNEGQPK